ncbi:tagatose-6-phosphate kinase [soil metagenome]
MDAQPRLGSSREGPLLLCVTPSPAIDRTARVERVVTGVILRALEVVALPGGKGVNAARVARRLGARVITTGVAGGHAGRWIVEALEHEGLEPHFAMAEAESRTTYVIVDAAGDAVIVYERPATATEAELEAFLDLLRHGLLPRADRAVVAGSLPSGVPVEGFARIVMAAREVGCPLLVDTSGEGLKAALSARPDIVKVGLTEVREAGLVDATATPVEAALALAHAGARFALVTDGARQAAATDGRHTWIIDVPRVEAVNAVGSGDAVNAGLSMALAEGASVEEALARGIAAGSANALSLSGGDLDLDTVRRLETQVRVAMLTTTGS